jgi:hypothetical protein
LRRFQSHASQLGKAVWASAERSVAGSITGADAQFGRLHHTSVPSQRKIGRSVMRAHLITKLLSISAQFFAMLLVTFLVIQLAPGGPVDQMLTRLHEWLIDDGIDRGPIR